ncbi:MAG: prepilin-type N-terminal cleavage/methylation domain-containing protein [bacterium]|nr:prepilin-type N-terminal cleavage/methylation domain-containing protein [bacterium]
MKKKLCQFEGFTLIEVMIVTVVVVILGLITTDVLTQSLRGQSKVKVINQVKQNGQVILEKLSSEIRQAEKVVCTDHNTTAPNDYDTLVIFGQNALVGTPSAQITGNGYTRFRFYNATPGSNGYIASDTFSLEDAQNITSVFGNLCVSSAPQPSGKNYLSDLSSTGGVSLSREDNITPVFDWDYQAGYGDLVTVTFQASEGKRAGGTYESQVESGGVPFATTVKVRGSR